MGSGEKWKKALPEQTCCPLEKRPPKSSLPTSNMYVKLPRPQEIWLLLRCTHISCLVSWLSAQEVESLRSKLAADQAVTTTICKDEASLTNVKPGVVTLLEPSFGPAALASSPRDLGSSKSALPQSLPQLSPFEEWKRAKLIFSYGGGGQQYRLNEGERGPAANEIPARARGGISLRPGTRSPFL